VLVKHVTELLVTVAATIRVPAHPQTVTQILILVTQNLGFVVQAMMAINIVIQQMMLNYNHIQI